MQRLLPFSLVFLAAMGTALAQDASPGRYVSPKHGFSFPYAPAYTQSVTENGDREDITFTGTDGKTVLVATFLPHTGTGAPLPFPALVEQRGIPSCTGICTVSPQRETELWVGPGLNILRYYYMESFLPPSERISSRGPLYAVDIHPGQGDLLVFSPKSTAAESLLLSALSGIEPALSPRAPAAPASALSPSPSPSEESGTTVSSATGSGLVTAPASAPLAPTVPASAATDVSADEAPLLFGIFSLQLGLAQMGALALGLMLTAALIFIHVRQKRQANAGRAELLQQQP